MKEVQKKDDVVDKPDPLKISKPGHGAVEEEKGRINEDYGRPGLREREGADDDVE